MCCVPLWCDFLWRRKIEGGGEGRKTVKKRGAEEREEDSTEEKKVWSM